MSDTSEEITSAISKCRATLESLQVQLNANVLGQDQLVKQLIIALAAGGHVLLEGLPGLGKTLLVKALAQTLSCKFSRVQFTPDLVPSDITGCMLCEEDTQGQRHFRFRPGPIFTNLLLADEINRGTPKTQAALLEAMAEFHVTVDTSVHSLPDPFVVVATQNPIEMEGTYPLPEAQIDRFMMKIMVSSPSLEQMTRVLEQTTSSQETSIAQVCSLEDIVAIRKLVRDIVVTRAAASYAANIIAASNPQSPLCPSEVGRYLAYGSSIRGGQALLLAAKVSALLDGRINVSFADIQDNIKPCLRHRLILNFMGEAENLHSDDLLDKLLESVTPQSHWSGTQPK